MVSFLVIFVKDDLHLQNLIFFVALRDHVSRNLTTTKKNMGFLKMVFLQSSFFTSVLTYVNFDFDPI